MSNICELQEPGRRDSLPLTVRTAISWKRCLSTKLHSRHVHASRTQWGVCVCVCVWGGGGAKPPLPHYIITTYNVKLRCHADNIIVSLYGRIQSASRHSDGENKSPAEVYTCIHLQKWSVAITACPRSRTRVSHSFVCFP